MMLVLCQMHGVVYECAHDETVGPVEGVRDG